MPVKLCVLPDNLLHTYMYTLLSGLTLQMACCSVRHLLAAAQVTLEMNFDTEANYDIVRVYDGTSDSATELGQGLSGDEDDIPEGDKAISSSNNNAYVTFHSDSSVTSGSGGFVGGFYCSPGAHHALPRASSRLFVRHRLTNLWMSRAALHKSRAPLQPTSVELLLCFII